jgi:hypothetical protein
MIRIGRNFTDRWFFSLGHPKTTLEYESTNWLDTDLQF